MLVIRVCDYLSHLIWLYRKVRPYVNDMTKISDEEMSKDDFSLMEVCNAVLDVWQPKPDNKVIINLPATVENSLPHVFANSD